MFTDIPSNKSRMQKRESMIFKNEELKQLEIENSSVKKNNHYFFYNYFDCIKKCFSNNNSKISPKES